MLARNVLPVVLVKPAEWVNVCFTEKKLGEIRQIRLIDKFDKLNKLEKIDAVDKLDGHWNFF